MQAKSTPIVRAVKEAVAQGSDYWTNYLPSGELRDAAVDNRIQPSCHRDLRSAWRMAMATKFGRIYQAF